MDDLYRKVLNFINEAVIAARHRSRVRSPSTRPSPQQQHRTAFEHVFGMSWTSRSKNTARNHVYVIHGRQIQGQQGKHLFTTDF